MTQTITIKDPQVPATDKQLHFLTVLLAERDNPTICQRAKLVVDLGTLTKGTASDFIGKLLASPKKPAAETIKHLNQTASVPVTPVAAPIVPTLTEAPAFGYYQVGETLYHWDVTGKDSKPTLRRLSVVTNYDGSKKGSWKKSYGNTTGTQPVKLPMTYTPYNGKAPYVSTLVTTQVWIPGVIVKAALNGIKPLTQDEAAALGKAYTFCIRCGATLTDPVSVANGIGPVCATYWA